MLSLPIKRWPFPFNCLNFPGDAPVMIWPPSTFNVAVCSVLKYVQYELINKCE